MKKNIYLYFMSCLISLCASSSRAEVAPIDIAFKGDSSKIDLSEVYNKAPLKNGDMLPEKTRNGSRDAHCLDISGFKPRENKYDVDTRIQYFTCLMSDPQWPAAEYSAYIRSETGFRISSLSIDIKKNVILKDEKAIREMIKLPLIEPIYDASEEEEGPGHTFRTSVKMDAGNYADLVFKKVKGGLRLSNMVVRTCVGDWVVAQGQFPDWEGICAVVKGEKEIYAKSPAYKKPKKPSGPLTTADVETALSPTALLALSKFKIGQEVPADARKNEGPGHCLEGWKPTQLGFTGWAQQYSESTSIGCNNKNEDDLVQAIDVWALFKTEKIRSITFGLKPRMVVAKSLADLDRLLGKTVLINSSHPDVKKPLSGGGYFYYNKIEPNTLAIYQISVGKGRVAVREVDLYDCAELRDATVHFPVCQKLGLVKNQ